MLTLVFNQVKSYFSLLLFLTKFIEIEKRPTTINIMHLANSAENKAISNK